MTQTNSNTNARKGKHLTDGERYQIQILLKEGYSHRHIGRVLGRNHQTINNEVKRGTVTQIDRVTSNGKLYTYSEDIYFADVGQTHYDEQRLKSDVSLNGSKPHNLWNGLIKRCWKRNGPPTPSFKERAKTASLRTPSFRVQPPSMTGLIAG